MSDFNCKCTICGTEQSYPDMKAAYLDGFTWGKNSICWECSKKPNYRKDVVENIISLEDNN